MLASERKGIDQATQNFNTSANEALNTYKTDVKENTGIQGYQNALQQAQVGARGAANNATANATAKAQNAALNTGMSKAAASLNAANTAANTYAQQYGSTLTNQQNLVQQQQQNKVVASGNIYSKQLEQAKTIYQQKLAEYQDKIDRRNQMYNMIFSLASGIITGGAGGGALGSLASTGWSWLKSQAGTPYNPSMYANANANITSDENEKKSNIDNFLDHLQAYAFEYKDKEKEDSDQHVGVTAQDVAKTRPDMVEEDEEGRLQLNRNKLIETVAAGIAELKKEFEENDSTNNT